MQSIAFEEGKIKCTNIKWETTSLGAVFGKDP